MIVLITGCKDDSLSAGAGALESNEEIKVCSASLGGISSCTDSLPAFRVTQTPDSFLLGECNSVEWATIKADLLAQFACPLGAQFPDSVVFDSVVLAMTCSSWFGDGNGSLRISAYELDGEPLYFDSTYSCNINLKTHWSGESSRSAIEEDIVVVPSKPTDSVYSSYSGKYIPYFKMKINKSITEKLEKACKKGFPSTQEEFNQNIFKGLYITTTQGAASALYIGDITMIIYYRYYFKKQSTDTEYTVAHDTKYLYANREVRQVNRYTIPDKGAVITKYPNYNFVISPAYDYTVVTLPIGKYVQQIQDSLNGLRPYINKALMKVNVVNLAPTTNRWTIEATSASDMLLICKDSLQDFFLNNRLPSSDYCLFSSLQYYIDNSYIYHYYYTFDLSTMLQNELRMTDQQHSEIEMVLVPVFLEYASTSTSVVVSKVKLNQTITFTTLEKDMNIETVFSGFTVRGAQ